jgi:hypothetical protein
MKSQLIQHVGLVMSLSIACLIVQRAQALEEPKPVSSSASEALKNETTIKPMTLGSPKPLPKKIVQKIKVELMKRFEVDQKVRKGIDPTKIDQSQMDLMQKTDTENTLYLKNLVATHGWTDVNRFGANTSNAAFFIVQHSGDVALMQAVLPEIEKDVKAKHLDAQAYAFLYDRTQIMVGKKQRFGTQIGVTEDGNLLVLALEDTARVEIFRKEIGLFPLSQYFEIVKAQYKGKEIIFEESQ